MPMYIIGRSNCDIVLEDDPSISRLHAKIYICPNKIQVEDECSKYGIFLNRNIETNETHPKKTRADMNSGDTIRFGRFANTWRLENVPIVCCSSTLNPELVVELKKLLTVVNGQYKNEFSESQTHLVMSSITMTIKGKMRRKKKWYYKIIFNCEN